jgi:hypothetical protein
VGSFYTNITLRTSDQNRVVDALKSENREAFVSSANGCTVVFDSESEQQDLEILRGLANRLSEKLRCAALAVLNHDDDVLVCSLHESGRLVDEYNSSPSYFTDGDMSMPEGGDAERWCRAFGAQGKAKDVERILRTSGLSSVGYTFEMDRHADLVAALGLPPASVSLGFNYLEEGEFGDGNESDFVRVE